MKVPLVGFAEKLIRIASRDHQADKKMVDFVLEVTLSAYKEYKTTLLHEEIEASLCAEVERSRPILREILEQGAAQPVLGL